METGTKDERKLVIHEGLTELEEMKLGMLKRVLHNNVVLPLFWLIVIVLGLIGLGWFITLFVEPLLSAVHGR